MDGMSMPGSAEPLTSTTISSVVSSVMSSVTAAAVTGASSTAPATASGGVNGMAGMGGSSDCKISMLWNWYTVDACFLTSHWHITSTGMFAGSCIGVILLTISLEALRRAVKEFDRFLIRRHLAAAAVVQQHHYHNHNQVSSISAAASEAVAATGNPSSSPLLPSTASPPPQGGEGGGGRLVCCCSTAAPSYSASITTAPTPLKSEQLQSRKNSGDILEAVVPPPVPVPVSGCGVLPLSPFRPSVLQQAARAGLHTVQFAVAYVLILAMYYNGYFIICIFVSAFLGAMVFQWETLRGRGGGGGGGCGCGGYGGGGGGGEEERTSAAGEATVCCG